MSVKHQKHITSIINFRIKLIFRKKDSESIEKCIRDISIGILEVLANYANNRKINFYLHGTE